RSSDVRENRPDQALPQSTNPPKGVYTPIPSFHRAAWGPHTPYAASGVATLFAGRSVVLLPAAVNAGLNHNGFTPAPMALRGIMLIPPGLKKSVVSSWISAAPAPAIPVCFCPCRFTWNACPNNPEGFRKQAHI